MYICCQWCVFTLNYSTGWVEIVKRLSSSKTCLKLRKALCSLCFTCHYNAIFISILSTSVKLNFYHIGCMFCTRHLYYSAFVVLNKMSCVYRMTSFCFYNRVRIRFPGMGQSYIPHMIHEWIWSISGMILTGKTEELPLHPSKIPHGLPREWI